MGVPDQPPESARCAIQRPGRAPVRQFKTTPTHVAEFRPGMSGRSVEKRPAALASQLQQARSPGIRAATHERLVRAAAASLDVLLFQVDHLGVVGRPLGRV
ncbi:MAG: hypothetical protein Q8R98_07335, partial [Rubrivivax sp.]|nr:hypothetical protein [Rubrivivax sp.]